MFCFTVETSFKLLQPRLSGACQQTFTNPFPRDKLVGYT